MAITREQRWFFADKLMDAANLALAASVIGQFVSGATPNWSVVTLGLVIYMAALSVSLHARR